MMCADGWSYKDEEVDGVCPKCGMEHVCLKYDRVLKHQEAHPHLYKCLDCILMGKE